MAAVLALAGAVCLTGSFNDLMTKVTANVFTQKYAFFVDQAANILYAIFAAVPVTWAIAFERTGSFKNRLPDGLLRCPQHRYAFMGLLDALGTFLSSIGAPGTPGHLQVMLCQTLILFTMATAFLWMGTRHDVREVVCACTIFGGAMVAASGSAAAEGGAEAQLWSVIMFTLSNVPMALSNVYKELAFADKSLRLDVWSMTCVTTFYQTLATFLLLPLQMLPYMSGDPQRGLSLAESWQSFVGGAGCYFGRSSNADDVDCSIAGPLLTIYVLANLGFNFLSFCLMKLGSATGVGSVLCSLAYAVKMPISNLLFAQPFLMGSQAEELSSRSLVGLVIVVGGFLGYLYFSGPGKGDAQEKLEQAAAPPEEQTKTLAAADDESATLYLQFGHDDEGGGPLLARTFAESARAVPDDAEQWAFHDRLIGCDSSNSARLVSSRQLKQGMAELMCGAKGPGREEDLPGL